MRQRRGGLALALVVFMVVLEAALRWLDPIGTMTYSRTLYWTHTVRLPAHSGYVHTPGVYRVSGHPVTIGLDGLRVTPPRNDAACAVAILGDSVAFGLGVGDEDTFTWRLAERFPDVRWVNTGRTGYNADNLRRVLDEHTPDGWLYYAVSNDAGDPTTASNVYRMPLALTLHWRVVRTLTAATRPATTDAIDRAAFDALVTDLQGRGALIVSADGHAVSAHLTARGAGTIIPAHGHPISAVDPHPDADGHAIIADALTPLVADWLPGVCGREGR